MSAPVARRLLLGIATSLVWTIAITDDPESTSVRGGVVVQVDP